MCIKLFYKENDDWHSGISQGLYECRRKAFSVWVELELDSGGRVRFGELEEWGQSSVFGVEGTQ